jgi:NTP pyrophosphatase (non-canonical NTP hydrolase)
MNRIRDENSVICHYKGWDRNVTVNGLWLLLTEEIGELASALRQHQGIYSKRRAESIEDEMGDVFSYLFQLASVLGVDLDQMWAKQKFKMIGKEYTNELYRPIHC